MQSERISSTSLIEEIVNRYGFITDFKQYSDISIVLTVEIPEKNIKIMAESLRTILDVNEIEEPIAQFDCERVLYLNATFSQSAGYLKHFVIAN